jgi:hypothetical protein
MKTQALINLIIIYMKILMVSGYAGSGKDALSELFIPHGYKTYAFADAVKTFVAETHGFPINLTYSQEGKATQILSTKTKKTHTVRQLLINDSLEMKILHNDPAFWAHKVAGQINISRHQQIIISDWRYKAEINYLVSRFPDSIIKKIRIFRKSVTPINDPSEHDLDDYDFDYIVHNTGTLSDLNTECLKILNLL